MSGQTMSYKEKQNRIQEYLKQKDIYHPKPMSKFDFRGYAKYVVDNGIDPSDVPQEIAKKFWLAE